MSVLPSLYEKEVMPGSDLGGHADIAYLPTQKERLPMKYAKVTKWFFAPILGQPRGVDTTMLRNFCESAWVKMCVHAIVDEVCSIDWAIKPIDDEDENSYYPKMQEKITTFFNNPNRNNESLKHIFRQFVRDLVEVDAAVIVKVFNSGDYEKEEYFEIPYQMYKKLKLKGGIMKGGKCYVKKNPMRELGQKTIKKQVKGMVEESIVDVPDDKFELTEIYAKDGGSFLKDVDLFGINYGFWQYSYMQPSYMPRWFDKKEIIYASMNPRSEHVYGWAPIQSCMEIVEAQNNSVIWNRDFFYNKAMPDGILNFGNVDEDTLEALKAEWQKEIKGKAHKLLMISNPRTTYSSEGADKGNSIDFTPIQRGQREMEFLDSQKWNANVIFSMFKCSMAEIGITPEVKAKAIQEGQERVHVRRAVLPILDIIEYLFNTELMTEFFNRDDPKGKTGGLQFKFDYIDPVDEAKQKENEIKDLDSGIVTINEVRQSRGMEPVEWGDEPLNKSGYSPNEPEEGFEENEKGSANVDNEAKQKEKDDKKKKAETEKSIKDDEISLLTKKKEVELLEKKDKLIKSLLDESTPKVPVEPDKKVVDTTEKLTEKDWSGYSGYLENAFKDVKSTIMKAVDTELKTEILKNKNLKVKKTFNEFVRKMINKFFSKTFSDKFYNDIEGYIRDDLKLGVTQAEKELGTTLSKSFTVNEAALLTEQQIQGYTMWDGGKFVGIKGAVQSVQKNIISNLNEAIGKDDVTEEDLKSAVNKAWEGNEGLSESRTLRIARTETSRIVNKGKLTGAQQAGLNVKKKWTSYPGECDICDQLAKNKAIPLDEWFVHKDSKFQHPPAHPQCRCSVELVK